MAVAPAVVRRFLPSWAYITLGTLVVVATYVYLVVVRPASLEGAVGGSGALIALVGYLVGAVLIIVGAMSALPTASVALLPVAIAINLVVGQLVAITGIPLYLDSIGTIVVGVLAGPAAGAATGALSNVIWGVTLGPTNLPFSIVAAEIGLLAGLFARLGVFREGYAAGESPLARLWAKRWVILVPLAGLVTGVVSAVLSAPIAAYVFGGGAGSAGRSAITAAFQAYGSSVLEAATLQGFVTDPLDKVVSFILAVLILRALPVRFRERFPFVRRYRVFGGRRQVVDR